MGRPLIGGPLRTAQKSEPKEADRSEEGQVGFAGTAQLVVVDLDPVHST